MNRVQYSNFGCMLRTMLILEVSLSGKNIYIYFLGGSFDQRGPD